MLRFQKFGALDSKNNDFAVTGRIFTLKGVVVESLSCIAKTVLENLQSLNHKHKITSTPSLLDMAFRTFQALFRHFLKFENPWKSQDLLNENNIQDRLNAELNWLEGSRPSSVSIEDLLSNGEGPKSPRSSSIEEKKKKLTEAGLFRDRLPQRQIQVQL